MNDTKPELSAEEAKALTRFIDLVAVLTLFATVPSEENELSALAVLEKFPEVIRLNGRLLRQWVERNGLDLEQLQQEMDEELLAMKREMFGPVRLIHSRDT